MVNRYLFIFSKSIDIQIQTNLTDFSSKSIHIPVWFFFEFGIIVRQKIYHTKNK